MKIYNERDIIKLDINTIIPGKEDIWFYPEKKERLRDVRNKLLSPKYFHILRALILRGVDVHIVSKKEGEKENGNYKKISRVNRKFKRS